MRWLEGERNSLAEALLPGDEAGHGAVLGADEAALREVVAIDAVELFAAVAPAANVVVSHHVELGEELGQRAVGLGDDLVAGHGDQPRGVVVVQDLIQSAQRLHAAGHILVWNLVARAPDDDGGMIAVARDHVGQVARSPLVEVAVVAVLRRLRFGLAPLVEGLGHHQEAHAVAEVEELGCVRIVAGADGVAAHLLQQSEAPLPDSLRHRCAHRASIVVQADAVQLDAFAVQQKSLVRIELRWSGCRREWLRRPHLALPWRSVWRTE